MEEPSPVFDAQGNFAAFIKEEIKVEPQEFDSQEYLNMTIKTEAPESYDLEPSSVLPPKKQETKDYCNTAEYVIKELKSEIDLAETSYSMGEAFVFPPIKDEPAMVEAFVFPPIKDEPAMVEAFVSPPIIEEPEMEDTLLLTPEEPVLCIETPITPDHIPKLTPFKECAIKLSETDSQKNCLESECCNADGRILEICDVEKCFKLPLKDGSCISSLGSGDTYPRCKSDKCVRYSQKGGYCISHGGIGLYPICKSDNCVRYAHKGGYCISHGGIGLYPICKSDNCVRYAHKGGYCISHGGTGPYGICKSENCVRYAHKGGYCISHGGIGLYPICKSDTCIRYAQKGHYCIPHSGTDT